MDWSVQGSGSILVSFFSKQFSDKGDGLSSS